MMKNSGKNNNTGDNVYRRRTLRKWLAGFLAASTAFSMLSGSAAVLMADEPSTEYALAGAGSGQDVTVHFGNDNDKDINIHVNPETGVQESETLAGLSAETELSTEAEVETEAETEPETENVEEKRVYTYEDDKVLVTATLEKADAVPSDAVLRVTPVTSDSDGYNYDAYMEALNEKALSKQDSDELTTEAEEKAFTDENTLLYDIAFIVCDYDEEGNSIEGTEREFEPEEGTVTVSITFRQDQLTNEINAESADDITVGHLPLNDSAKVGVDTTKDATDISKDDITVSPLNADKSIEGEQSVAFTTDSFSVYYIGRDNQEKKIEIQFVTNEGEPDSIAALRYAYVYVQDNSDLNQHVLIPIDLSSDRFNRNTGIYTISEADLINAEGRITGLSSDRQYTVQIWQQYDQSANEWKLAPDKHDGDRTILVSQANTPSLVGMYYFTLPEENSNLSDYKIVARKIPYSTSSSPEEFHAGVLGDAIYYGVTADVYHQQGSVDTQTNFAVKTYVGTTPVGGDLSNNPGNIVVGDIPDGSYIQIRSNLTPYSSTVYYGKQISNEKIVQNSSQNLVPMDQTVINNFVDQLISNAVVPASSVQPLKLTKTGSNNQYYLDTVALGPNAVLYVTLDETESTGNGEHTFNEILGGVTEGVRINKLPSQTIIFQTSGSYETEKSALKIGQIRFDNTGNYLFNDNTNSDTSDSEKNHRIEQYCETVFWSAPNAKNVNMTDAAVAGTFLFPNATVKWTTACSGWIVCHDAIGNGEWHNIFRRMKDQHLIPHPEDLKTSLKIVKEWRDENNELTDAPVNSINVNVNRKLAAPVGDFYKVEIYVCYTESGKSFKNLTKVVYVKKTNSGSDSVDIVIADSDSTHEYHATNVYPYTGNDTYQIGAISEGRRTIHLANLAQYEANGKVEVCISGAATGVNAGIASIIAGFLSVPEDSYTAPEFAVPENTVPDAVFGTVSKTLSSSNNWTEEILNLDKEVDTVDTYYTADWKDKLGCRWFYYIEEPESFANGFEVTYNNNGINYGIITVTNRKPGTSITVSKKWNDDGNNTDDNANHDSDQIVVRVYKVLTPAGSAGVSANPTDLNQSADVLCERPSAKLEAESADKTRSEDNALKFNLQAKSHYNGPLENVEVLELEYDYLKDKAFSAVIEFSTDKPIDPSQKYVNFWCEYPSLIDSKTDQNTSSVNYPVDSIGDNKYRVTISDIVIPGNYHTGTDTYTFLLKTLNYPNDADITAITSAQFSGEGVVGDSQPQGSNTNEPTTTPSVSSGGTGGSNQNTNSSSSGNSNTNPNGSNDVVLNAQSDNNSDGVIEEVGAEDGTHEGDDDGEDTDDPVDPDTGNQTPQTTQTPQNDNPSTGESGGRRNASAPVDESGMLPRTVLVQEITLKKDHWSETIDHLPLSEYAKDENGQDVLCDCTYYVEEVEVPEGYEVSYDRGSSPSDAVTEGTINITNTKLGKLIIYKKTNTVHTTPDNTNFHITGPEGFEARDVKYSDFRPSDPEHPEVERYYEITGLKPGTYKVEENVGRTEIGGALYFAGEEDSSKYQLIVTYSSTDNKTDGTTQIAQGGESTIEIDNEYWTSYAMPATGGEGTRRMLLLGIMLIAFAGAGFILVRRRRVMTR